MQVEAPGLRRVKTFVHRYETYIIVRSVLQNLQVLLVE